MIEDAVFCRWRDTNTVSIFLILKLIHLTSAFQMNTHTNQLLYPRITHKSTITKSIKIQGIREERLWLENVPSSVWFL